MKTLAVVLNYNLPEATDLVVDALAPHCGDAVDLRVLDNGSPPQGRSRHTTDQTGTNLHFGGGLNWAFARMLENPEYEYLLFLNNDIVLHGPRFVSALAHAARAGDHAIVSPCILHPGQTQNFWPTMHNWGHRKPRRVEWVDFTAPLIHRKVVEAIGQFDDGLLPGYGYDVLCGMVCADRGWSIAVCDFVPIVHAESSTLRSGRGDMSVAEYRELAKANMRSYFRRIGRLEELEGMRARARRYRPGADARRRVPEAA